MTEEWRAVVGFEGEYDVSSIGRVRNAKTGKVRALFTTKSGYRALNLYRDGCKYSLVHRLVLEAFVGPSPGGFQACHWNGDPSDNRLENLRWDSPKANAADRSRHGRTAANACPNYGEANGFSKLNSVDVERIRDMRRSGCLQVPIAKWLGYSHSAVSKVLLGHTWKHVA